MPGLPATSGKMSTRKRKRKQVRGSRILLGDLLHELIEICTQNLEFLSLVFSSVVNSFEEFGVLVLLIMSLNAGCCFLTFLNVDNDANRKEFRVFRSCPLRLETTRWKYLMKMSSLCNSMRIMLVFLPTWILLISTSACWQSDKILDLNPSFMFLDAYCVSCLRYLNLEF